MKTDAAEEYFPTFKFDLNFQRRGAKIRFAKIFRGFFLN